MAQLCVFIFAVLICGISASPFRFEDDAVDNTIDDDGNFRIDLSHLGPRIFGAPSSRTGDLVASWNPNSGVNPEELGEYAEGDILHPPSSARNGLAADSARWKNGIVPYVITGSYSSTERDLLKKAIAAYHRLTCIRFVQRTNEEDYLDIGNRKTGCWSSVGRLGQRQEVNLQSPGCVSKVGTIIHELMHALGFVHEQSRPERDNYVNILFQNIKSGDAYNFKKSTKDSVKDFGVQYDYGSVMHYGAYAFSSNQQPTIVPKQSGAQIGQREGLSQSDVRKLNAMYQCPNKGGAPIINFGTSILEAFGSLFSGK